MGKLCQRCSKREAKIHFTEIKDGKKTELHICEDCAHEKNMVLAFPSLLSHIIKEGPQDPPVGEAVPSACPRCGLTYAEFKAKGRLGCPACYQAFAPVLVPLLEKVHGKRKHVGSTPSRLKHVLESRKELDLLEDELSAAVSHEQYENAARLRDQIREFREKREAEAAAQESNSED